MGVLVEVEVDTVLLEVKLDAGDEVEVAEW